MKFFKTGMNPFTVRITDCQILKGNRISEIMIDTVKITLVSRDNNEKQFFHSILPHQETS